MITKTDVDYFSSLHLILLLHCRLFEKGCWRTRCARFTRTVSEIEFSGNDRVLVKRPVVFSWVTSQDVSWSTPMPMSEGNKCDNLKEIAAFQSISGKLELDQNSKKKLK